MSQVPPKMIEISHIAPPNGTVESTTLPLTFFDTTWLSLPPVGSLLFYSYPITKDIFLKEFLPNLKQSLSITLQHFFPYASSLIIPPPPQLPYLHYADGVDSSLLFIIAESARNDFGHLISDSPKDARLLDDFKPKLPNPRVSPEGFQVRPIMAMQVTLFPGNGISIGNASTHVVADGLSFSNFMKFWMSLCKQSNGGDPTIPLPSLPIHNCRNKIKGPIEVATGFLEQYWSSQISKTESKDATGPSPENIVRATFTISRNQIDSLKRWINEQSSPVSTFVATLAFAWVSLIKTLSDKDKEEIFYFLYMFDCRKRLLLPLDYVGNCVAPRLVSVKKQDLVGENGVLVASDALRASIKEMLSSNVERTAPTWGQELRVWLGSHFPVNVAGAPSLGLYDSDFGMGRPCKLEIMHLRVGEIGLSESRDGSNGVEMGLVLEKTHMEAFASILQHGINNFQT